MGSGSMTQALGEEVSFLYPALAAPRHALPLRPERSQPSPDAALCSSRSLLLRGFLGIHS